MGVIPLLGLEPPDAENKEQNADRLEDPNQSASPSPLLGTIFLFAEA